DGRSQFGRSGQTGTRLNNRVLDVEEIAESGVNHLVPFFTYENCRGARESPVWMTTHVLSRRSKMGFLHVAPLTKKQEEGQFSRDCPWLLWAPRRYDLPCVQIRK